MSLSLFCPAVADTPIPSNITLQLGTDSSLTTSANSLFSYGMSLRLHSFPCGSPRTFHTTNIFSLCLSMKINHKLEYIPLSEYMPWLFYLENIVSEHRDFGCESGPLQHAASHCWLPGNVIKASLLCGLWLWSSICQKRGDRRGSECFSAPAFLHYLTLCDR